MSAPAFALRGGGAANPFLGAAVEAGHDVCAGPSSPLPVEALPAPDVAADLDR